MTDTTDAITRIKAHGYRFFGLSGREFLAADGTVLTVEEALAEVEKHERKGAAST